jgi:hypothetical protein
MLLALAAGHGFRPHSEGHASHPVLGREQRGDPTIEHAEIVEWFHKGYGVVLVNDEGVLINFGLGPRTDGGMYEPPPPASTTAPRR